MESAISLAEDDCVAVNSLIPQPSVGILIASMIAEDNYKVPYFLPYKV